MINIQDIIPFMKDGWVAMDQDGEWNYWAQKPHMKHESYWWALTREQCCLSDGFDIAIVVNVINNKPKKGGKD